MTHRRGTRTEGTELSYRRMSSPMLEEAFQAHGQSGHRFTKKTFTRPTYCHHCTEMLWGFTNQGYTCEVCNFVTHERCLTNVITACVSIATTLVKNPVAHTWGGNSFYRRKFCNVCRKRLDDCESFRCQVCEYFVHDTCKEFGISDCKQSATFIPTSNKSTQILTQTHGHHWREGNIGLGAKCVYCKRSCGTMECLASYRCSWCAQTAHSGCFEMLPKECGFGYLHRLSLPPFCVSLPNIDLWGPWRNSKTGNLQSLQGSYVDEDDGIVPDHPATQSTFSATSSHSLETKEVAHLDVYDGNIHSPKTRKTIPVPRNVQVDHLLNEALKKFCINDDPNNYYLAKVVDQNIERPLDLEEMPVQFSEIQKRPLIFLRMKSADRRKGYIRIYSGLQIDVPSTFRTLPVSASTTVLEVLQLALQKFGIRDARVDDYVLTEMHLHQGVEERFMQSHESPWKCLMDIRKKSIRQMKFARFYLRRKLEPCVSSCLCVGNLPTYLVDKARYEAVLDDILKDISEYCEVESVHPSYGMVFVKLPSADLAAEAIDKLKGSVVDGKDVFVKLLPTIHPEALPIECHPLLVFVNPKSGGGQGDDIMSAFQRLLNPNQVYNLLDGGPLPGLYAFKDIKMFRILICGGDGTVGWVLSCLDDISSLLKCKKPPSAIVPLGTGNDLSRVLNWGGGYSSGESPLSLLIAVDHANTGLLDRWFIIFDNADTPLSDTKSNDSAIGMGCNREDEPNMFVMNNYFGIGIDADLCLDFHLKREEAPQKFTSRLHNKGVYLRAGLRKMAKRSSICLSDEVEVEVDGEQITLPAVGGLVFLNIGSWGAGADLWGPYREEDGFSAADHDDGMIEVVGLTGVMQMGQIQSGMRYGLRIAQGSQINIRLKSELPVQIDGEPWMQSAGQVIIRPALMQAAMLSKRRVKAKQLHQRAAISRPTSAPNIPNSVFYNE